MRYNSQGLKRDVALQIVGVSKHQYYYISKKTKQGMKTSTTTSKNDGTEVDNKEIVSKIKELISKFKIYKINFTTNNYQHLMFSIIYSSLSSYSFMIDKLLLQLLENSLNNC